MTYSVNSVDEYVDAIPADRRDVFQKLRQIAKENLPKGFEEGLSYGLPAFVVPFSLYPKGYHCRPEEPLPFISIAVQKNFYGFYHMGIYSYPELLQWFRDEYEKENIGKPDMGKSCLRFKKPEKIPYNLLARLCKKITVEEWIGFYEKSRFRPDS